ncbi:unnamed protein product [Rotaria socialis]|nr:unnamed protein product [Rotaria socialis]CAF3410763.1 unnamed protein product [Rotaria socialis]
MRSSTSSIWAHQQIIICIISVLLGTFLFIITFIVPAVIILCRIQRDKNRMNSRQLRRASDFMNEDMENETIQRRSTATINHMGVNSYSTFGAQGDLTNDKLTILPIIQDTHCIIQERHIPDIKHTFFDEQLASSTTTMNWDMEANYICPPGVHHTSNNNYIHLTDCTLQTNPSATVIQNTQTTKLNNDDEIQQPSTSNMGTAKQNFTNFTNSDLNGSKVIRLVRAKQATKRKSSLDTLIEVVQKELLRVNGQSNSTAPSSSPPHYSQTRSTTSSKQSQQQQQHHHHHRSVISSVLPSSHPNSLTSQSNHSFKLARKRPNHNLTNTKRTPSNRNRSKSFNTNDDFADDIDFMDGDDDDDEDINNNHSEQQQTNESMDDATPSTSETIEDIVRDTVDKLVAITLLNNAPFIVNMITGTPGNNTASSTNTESKPLANIVNTNTTSITKPITTIPSSDYYRNDLALLSSTASELRNSMQQTSPMKQTPHQQQQQMIIQTTQSNSIQTNSSIVSNDQMKSSASTLFVSPRILNFQTVVPKPTTNIQIGNTKIILVSSGTNHQQSSLHQQQQLQQTNLVNSSPVKLVKLSSALPKNVQIVIPSRTSNESLSTTTTTTLHPISTLTTCSIDQIPQAAQEVTITTSPNLNKLRRRSSSTTPTDKPVGKILRPIAKVLPVYSPNNGNHATSPSSTITTSPRHDELTKPMAINFQQRPTSTHGPMIYRMTSVNSNVPVFRVRATTAPTTSTINTDAKPMSVATATSMCYEPKQMHNTTTAGGSVSVLACFKTTKKRNKERAIMPRPSTTDPIDPSHDLQQRLHTTTSSNISTSTLNVPLTITNHNTTDDLANCNSTIFSSTDFRQQLTPTRLIQQYSLPTIATQTQHNDSTYDLNILSPNSIPIQHNSSHSIKTITIPLISPIQSLCSTSNIRPAMEDKCIQCIDDNENSIEQLTKGNLPKKRNGQSLDDNSSSDESWTVAADTLLRNVLSQYGFRFLDVNCQQNLSTKFDIIQANLVSGMILSKDEFYKSVHDIKDSLVNNGLSKISADNLEKLFNYFEVEYPKIRDGDSLVRTNDRKRTRRQ